MIKIQIRVYVSSFNGNVPYIFLNMLSYYNC